MATTPASGTTTPRDKGTGTRRADGVWRVRVTIDGRRRDFYGPTLTAAHAKARAAALPRAPRRAGALTVGEWLTTWIEDRRSNLKPQTWTRYAYYVRDQLVPAFGRVRLADVSVEDIRRFHARLRQSGLSGTTQHHAHVVLGTALQAAVEQGLLAVNPTRSIQGPRTTVRERTILSREEADRLLQAAQGDPYEALYVLAPDHRDAPRRTAGADLA